MTVNELPAAPRHGGNLHHAIKCYGGKPIDWLDLSTGISPWAYPAASKHVDSEHWRNLPAPPDALLEAAAAYYGCSLTSIGVTPGTQLAIRLLPTLIAQTHRVAIPRLGYQEHSFAWQNAGHEVVYYASIEELHSLVNAREIDSLVVINPNNPSGAMMPKQTLVTLSKRVAGVVVVDEAFADLDKTLSLSSELALDNIVILRSLGKFFGLAGARIGFVVSNHPLANALTSLLGPWSINGAAQELAKKALKDTAWQQQQIQRVLAQSVELSTLLKQYFGDAVNASVKSQGLFTTILGDDARLRIAHQSLAKEQIWTRLGDRQNGQNWLRFSLPGKHFLRLANSLTRTHN